MKKFYTMLALAVATTMSASALQPVSANFSAHHGSDLTQFAQKNNIVVPGFTKAESKAKATSMAEFVGEYDWTYAGYLESDSESGNVITVEIKAKEGSTNEVEIYGFVGEYAVNATVDFAKGTITIPYQVMFNHPSYGDVIVQHAAWGANYQGTTPDNADIVGTLTDGGFTFDSDDLMFIWIPNVGYFFAMDTMSAAKAAVDTTVWVDYDTADFVDGWAVTCYTEDPAEYVYEVQVQQDQANANILRIKNPYLNSPLAEVNTANGEGSIVFDVTDPDFVIVKTGYKSGFANSATGTQMYCYNVAGWLMAYYGYAADEVKAAMAEQKSAFSTLVDGVITVPECIFGIGGDELAAYSWVDSDNNPVEMTTVLTLKNHGGINDVTVDEANGPAAYYNLQGVRVENPESGLYIRVQGGKAVKVIR